MTLNTKNVRTIIFILFSCILFFFLLWDFSSVWKALHWIVGMLTPLIIGLCAAFVLNPLMRFLENLFSRLPKHAPGKKLRMLFRGLAIVGTLIIVCCVLWLIMLLVIPEVVDTINSFASQLPEYTHQALVWINSLPLSLPRFQALLQDEPDWDKIFSAAVEFLKGGRGTDMVSGVVGVTVSVLGGLFDVLFGLIISIYVLAQKEAIGRFFTRFTRAFFKKEKSDRIFHIARLSSESFSNFVTGQLLEAVIIGTLCFIGCSIFRFPFALSIAALVSLTALIPVFGAWIGAIIGGLLILTQSPIQALWFVLFLVVLQQLEGQLIYPKVVGKSVGLPGLLVMLAVLFGGDMAGILGMLFSVPLCSILYTLLKESINHRLQ